MTQPGSHPSGRNIPYDETRALSIAEPMALPEPARVFVLRDIVATAFMRRGLLMFAFLIPVLAGLVAAVLARETYTAQGLLIVLGSRESAGAQDIAGFGPSVLSIDQPKIVQSEINIIESEDVVEQVVRSIGPAELYPAVARSRLFGLLSATPLDLQVERATELFLRDLHADVEPNSSIVRVTYTYRDRAMAISALRRLLDVYFEQRQAIFQRSNAQFLADELSRVSHSLDTIVTQIHNVKASLGVLDVPQAIQLAAARADALESNADALRARQAGSLAQLAEAQRRLAAQTSRVFASQETTNQAPNDESRNTLLKLQVERDHLAEQYTTNYPPLAELDSKIATVRQAIAAHSAISTVREVRNPVLDVLTSRVTSLQVDTSSLDSQLAELERQIADARQRGIQLLTAEAKLAELDRQQASLDSIYRQFAAREAGARIDEAARQTATANVHVVQQPMAPTRARSMALSYILIGLVTALAATAAAATVMTWLRRTFASPDEAERSLALPALATFPGSERFDVGAENLALSGLASLLLDLPGDPSEMGLVQFLPATQAEAELTARLVRATAVELARAYGRKTLLVDLRGDGRDHLAQLGAQPMVPLVGTDGITAMNTVYPRLWVAFNAQKSALADVHAEQQATRALIDKLRHDFDRVLVIGSWDVDNYAVRRFTVLANANIIVVNGELTSAPEARHVRDVVLGAGGALLGLIYGGQRAIIPPRLARLL